MNITLKIDRLELNYMQICGVPFSKYGGAPGYALKSVNAIASLDSAKLILNLSQSCHNNDGLLAINH